MINEKKLLEHANKLDGEQVIEQKVQSNEHTYGFKLKLYKLKKGKVWVEGTTNRCADGRYVLYIDYDRMEQEWVVEELLHLQNVFDLGDIHLFKSSESKNGYHAVSFAKLTAYEFIQVLQNSSCDEAFKNVPRFSSTRNWVLRAWNKGNTEKPKYVGTLPAFTTRQSSYAHWKAWKLIHPQIGKFQPDYHDFSKDIKIIKYKTSNNI